MRLSAPQSSGQVLTTKSSLLPGRPVGKRKKLFAWHAWVGFHLAILTFLIVLTGTLATISHEIDWLLRAEMRVKPPESELRQPVSFAAMERAVRGAIPDEHRLGVISSMPTSSGAADHFAYRATIFRDSAPHYFVHVNQWTGDVTGVTSALTVQRFFRDLHRYLFMPSVVGLPLVTVAAVVLAISLYTGLKTARNWRKLAMRIRIGKGVRTMVGDAHKAAGIWSVPFFVIIIATGFWYFAEFVSVRTGVPFDPAAPMLSHDASLEEMARADVNVLVEAAQRAFPALTPVRLIYPSGPGRPAVVQGRAGNVFERMRANSVFLDPFTGLVIQVRRAEDLAFVAYVNQIADPLHFGYFGGLPTKLIWFVFGMMMTGLSVTGVWLTLRRLSPSGLSRGHCASLLIIGFTVISAVFWWGGYAAHELPALAVAMSE